MKRNSAEFALLAAKETADTVAARFEREYGDVMTPNTLKSIRDRVFAAVLHKEMNK